MKGIIGIEGHCIPCIIGDLPHEREEEQEIILDLKVETDISRCVETEKVEDAVDYVRLAEVSTQVAQRGKYCLLETFCHHLAQELLNTFPIDWVWMQVRKPHVLPTAAWAMVELKVER